MKFIVLEVESGALRFRAVEEGASCMVSFCCMSVILDGFRLVEGGRVEESVVELSELKDGGILRHGIRSLTCQYIASIV